MKTIPAPVIATSATKPDVILDLEAVIHSKNERIKQHRMEAALMESAARQLEEEIKDVTAKLEWLKRFPELIGVIDILRKIGTPVRD